jgi:hypothetical protein
LENGTSSVRLKINGDAMDFDAWPPLSVRDWRSVLAQRDPDWGSLEDDRDCILAAHESRRIHELRGVIVGQVAEIENLLLHIAAQVRERSDSDELRNRQVHGPAGAVLGQVVNLLKSLGHEIEFEDKLESIRETIISRNAIVHAVVDVGISYCLFNDSREVTIIGIRDNDKDKYEKRLTTAAELDPWEHDEMIPWDISEADLERQLARAYKALDDCIDIWVRVDEILPDPPRVP